MKPLTQQTTIKPQDGFIPLAWMDWGLRMPAEWRPLRLTGEWDRGAAMIGDGHRAILQLKWWRPRMRKFKPAKWIGRRVRAEAGRRAEPVEGPSPQGFAQTAWLPADPALKRRRALWYGFHEVSGLMLEAAIDGTVDQETQRTVEQKVLPSLTAAALDTPRVHAVFGASFGVPPAYRIESWKTMLGDITLKLARRTEHAALLVRQVYPAKLALRRRPLKQWLLDRPFKEHRQFLPERDDEVFILNTDDGELKGLCRTGSKRLPCPLGRVAALQSTSAIVCEEPRNRLLFAEHDAPGNTDQQAVINAIRGMDVVGTPQTGRRTR